MELPGQVKFELLRAFVVVMEIRSATFRLIPQVLIRSRSILYGAPNRNR